MKKILALCLVVVLAVTAVAGATLAYFTDSDSQKNVMTLGNVDIKQLEEQRYFDENGEFWTMGDFIQDKPLMPMVDSREEGEPTTENGYFHPNMKNVVDKIISVSNVADASVNATNKNAYVRTLIAFEGRCDVQGEYIGKLWNSTGENGEKAWDRNWVPKVIEGVEQPTDVNGLVNAREVMINDVVHTVIECIYVGTDFGEAGVLPADKTTVPSLKQIFMAPTANNEIVDWFGSDYTIYALTQATQVEGFEPVLDDEGNTVKTAAEVALDTAFGDPMLVDDQTMFDWFKAVQ